MRSLHTFIIRILRDETRQMLHGQVSDPTSADEWRASFANASELWQMLLERVSPPSATKQTSVSEENQDDTG